ncbi:MAG: hypothetical protein WCV90_06960 [Candidatus Woesearchaeota archaeon]
MTECGLTNLAICLPEKFFGYISSILTAPVQPFLDVIHYLLTEPVNINLFHSLWAVIIYVISLFYGLFFLFSGFNFMISGYDAAKREKAKEWFRNIVLMVLFVQASFLIYDLVIELGSLLTSGVINIIPPEFFKITVDNFSDIGTTLMLIIPYLLILIITILLLGLRYLTVAIGVVFLPIGIFFYFIPPLRSYGKLIINTLLVVIFVNFFSAIILFGASALVNVSVFANFKIILAMVAFLSINLLMVGLIIFALLKAVFGVLNSEMGSNIKSAVKYLI